MPARKLGLTLALSFVLLHPLLAWADPQLDYQWRGNRYEGVRPQPVAGGGLELVSVLVDHEERSTAMPERLRVKFYLPQQSDVSLTVRELNYREYYWLDGAQPAEGSPWRSGFDNEFAWQTGVVLQKLKLTVRELGVLARLGYQNPTIVERIAPAILYHARAPARVGTYIFTLKAGSDASVKCRILRQDSGKEVFTDMLPEVYGGRPFSVRWDAANASPGRYNFIVTGYEIDTNTRLKQEVHFYHQPSTR